MTPTPQKFQLTVSIGEADTFREKFLNEDIGDVTDAGRYRNARRRSQVEAARSERYRRDHCCSLAGWHVEACTCTHAAHATSDRLQGQAGSASTREKDEERDTTARLKMAVRLSLRLPGEPTRRDREREREGRGVRRSAVNGPLRNLTEEKGMTSKRWHAGLHIYGWLCRNGFLHLHI